MVTRIRWALLAGAAMWLGCSGADGVAQPVTPAQKDGARPAIAALQQGSFDEASRLAGQQIAAGDPNPYPRLVRAIARYKKSMHQLALDGRTIVVGGLDSGNLNQKYLRATLSEGEAELAAVEADLAFAARHPGISMELCLACWEIDWNANGQIDDSDRELLQIEQDEAGQPIPEGDPRRKPTFRFDDGDIPWARAFVSFERAALDVLLAYDWSELAGFARRRRDRPERVVLRLVEPERVAQARQRILEGLDHSDAARRAYLTETDDDREWVPSPRQKSHPMPMPVDQRLYDTWEGVVGDVRRLVKGDEGLQVSELIALAGERVGKRYSGFVNVGSMLARPKDIVLDLRELKQLERSDDPDAALAAVLGVHHAREMSASPLPKRLLRMRGEVDRGEEGFRRKLRYLFWLN